MHIRDEDDPSSIVAQRTLARVTHAYVRGAEDSSSSDVELARHTTSRVLNIMSARIPREHNSDAEKNAAVGRARVAAAVNQQEWLDKTEVKFGVRRLVPLVSALPADHAQPRVGLGRNGLFRCLFM